MKYEETKLEAFTVVGISVRTTNKDGKALNDIGGLFRKFFSEQIAATIPNKISDEVYCVYTDYESDFQGKYTTVLGCKVSSTENIPQSFAIKHIPESKYRKYQAQGEVHKTVGKIWSHIWSEGESIDRAYTADFDVYGQEARDPANAVVYTYLSIK